MTEPDITRYHPTLVCNSCKKEFQPYGNTDWAPILDEVACPSCSTKRILYYGNDASTVKMILSTYGINKELDARIIELENGLAVLGATLKSTIADAKTGMTEALINVSKEAIVEHERKWHNVR